VPGTAGGSPQRSLRPSRGKPWFITPLRAAPELDRARLCGPSRQPRVRLDLEDMMGSAALVDPRTHAHLLRLRVRGTRVICNPRGYPASAPVRARPHRGDLSSLAAAARCRAKSNTRKRQPCPTGSSAFPPDDRVPVVGQAALDRNFPGRRGAVAAALLRLDRTADRQDATRGACPGACRGNTGRFGYSLRMQSGERQVSTSTISTRLWRSALRTS